MKSLKAIVIVLLTFYFFVIPASAETILFEENFNQVNSNWLKYKDPGWTLLSSGGVAGGAMNYAWQEGLVKDNFMVLKNKDWRDFSVEAMIKNPAKANIGISFRVKANVVGNGYQMQGYSFVMTRRTQKLQRYRLIQPNGQIGDYSNPVILVEKENLYDFEVWHKLKVEVRGSNFKGYLDDKLVLEYNDTDFLTDYEIEQGKVHPNGPMFTSGSIGLIQYEAQGYWDNIVVKELSSNSPTPSPVISLTPTPPVIPSLTPINRSEQIFSPRVLFVAVNPVENGKTLVETYFSGALRGRTAQQWEDEWVSNYIAGFKRLSNNTINYAIAKKVPISSFTRHTQGTEYNFESYYQDCLANGINQGHCHDYAFQLNHVAFIEDNNLCNIAEQENVDEIWVMAPMALTVWEDFMVGPTTGFYINGPSYIVPSCKKHYYVTVANYDSTGNFFHSYGHRVEQSIAYVTRNFTLDDYNKYVNNFLALDRYQQSYDNINTVYPKIHCGNVEFPPNGIKHYDYANQSYKEANCPDWKNFPDFKGEKVTVNCSSWNCDDMPWQEYWFGSIPRSSGETRIVDRFGKTTYFQNNWWYYLIYPDNAINYIEGKSSLTPTPVQSASINLKLKVQGISTTGINKSSTANLLLDSQAQGLSKIVSFQSGTGGYLNGTVSNASPGQYTLLIRIEGYLPKKFNNLTINSGVNNLDLSSGIIKAGDFNNDSKLDFSDITLMLSKYKSLSVPVTSDLAKFDVFADNKFDFNDLSLVLGNYVSLVVNGDN